MKHDTKSRAYEIRQQLADSLHCKVSLAIDPWQLICIYTRTHIICNRGMRQRLLGSVNCQVSFPKKALEFKNIYTHTNVDTCI